VNSLLDILEGGFRGNINKFDQKLFRVRFLKAQKYLKFSKNAPENFLLFFWKERCILVTSVQQ
jgi:hypothetical protein